jgi:hypothetical protein
VSGSPDYGHVVELTGVELLPGECAAASDAAQSGLDRRWVRVQTRDPRREGRARWLRVPPGQITLIEVDEAGKPRRADRWACDGTPFNPVSADAAARRE